MTDGPEMPFAGRSVDSCLLVEDDKFDRMMLRRCLAQDRPDLRIHECGSLQAARDYLAQDAPDLIVLDNRLPDGRGAEFAAELRADRRMREVMICVVTNDDPISLDPAVPTLSKDEVTSRTLWDMAGEYLSLCAIAKGSDMAQAVEGFGGAVQSRLAPGVARMLRTLRLARARLGDRAPGGAMDELDKLEAMLLAMSELLGENGAPFRSQPH